MKACVDQDTCIGCGMCEGIAAENFRMNADGKAEFYGETGDANKAGVQEAIDSCPVAAISEE